MGMGRKKKSKAEEEFVTGLLGFLESPEVAKIMKDMDNEKNARTEGFTVEQIQHMFEAHSYLLEGNEDSVFLGIDGVHYIQINLDDMIYLPVPPEDDEEIAEVVPLNPDSTES